MPYVGIIGTAGRQGLHEQLDAVLWERMVVAARQIMTRDWQLDLNTVTLVSGGAAWADHVAVRLYRQGHVPQLRLHLPARWQAAAERFTYETPAGRAANHYHLLFGEALQHDPWHELQQAAEQGAVFLDHYDGFLTRNRQVAQEAEYLLAFTFTPGAEPSPQSGTHYTWSRCRGRKQHVCLLTL